MPPPPPSSIISWEESNQIKMLRMIARVKSLRSLTNQFQFQFQFIQHRSVSGTVKGKSKTKDGQLKKRNKIATGKKANPDPSAKPPSRQESEKYRLYDECMNAPTPVRFLKPREREREAEREKLGLESKGRKMEKEILKKGGRQAMGIPDEPLPMGTPGLDLVSLGLVDIDKVPKYELTEEDGKRLAKEYSRVMMRKHRARQAAESTLLRLKKEAIEALPEDLKKAALVPDLAPFPITRFMATLTPPIEGYIEKINEATKRGAGQEKIR